MSVAGGVAHDSNNMLGVILGHTKLALDQTEPGSPLNFNLEEIRKAANSSASLTNQLLAFTRKQTISPKLLDINEAVENLTKMLRRLIGEDIELTWLPGDNLSPVKIDPGQVDQILVNLCINAKESGKGTGLGLATVYGIIKQNNGYIDAYSEPGQGTSMKIYLLNLNCPLR